MTAFFVRQPNGLLARFWTSSDQFSDWNLTREEAIQLYLDECRRDAERRVQEALSDAPTRYTDAGESRWNACVAEALEAHSDDPELKQIIADASTVGPWWRDGIGGSALMASSGEALANIYEVHGHKWHVDICGQPTGQYFDTIDVAKAYAWRATTPIR